jgi:hypothetical protein
MEVGVNQDGGQSLAIDREAGVGLGAHPAAIRTRTRQRTGVAISHAVLPLHPRGMGEPG